MKTTASPKTGMIINRVCTWSLIWVLLALAGNDVVAKPEYREAFFAAYPSAVGTQLDNLPSRSGHCGVCHYRFNGGGTRNPYGVKVEETLGGFPETLEGRVEAILSIGSGDWDGDNFSSEIEVTDTAHYDNTPTFPGLTPANVSQISRIPVEEVQPYLIPSSGTDITPPDVTVLSPNGGEVFTGNRATNVTWTATDNDQVSAISIFVSIDNGATFQPVALGLSNSGSYSWVPANRPTAQALIRVVAFDNASNTNLDHSDGLFTIVSPTNGLVKTTLRDFDMPGTQPFEGGIAMPDPAGCGSCHGNYNPAVEPYFNWQGSMMAHASRDILFQANMAVANQDAADSGDLCLRCHLYRGWVSGRSVPTDGSRMQPQDGIGVSCVLCHRMVDPIPDAGNPPDDEDIVAALSNPPTHFANGMLVIDPNDTRRGPFADAVSPHEYLVSPFHKEAALCGSCHDVSNPAFEKDGLGGYIPNAFDTPATNFSSLHLLPVERTYSEWLNSAYNTPTGVYAPAFAGNKLDGMVATCQDCHMRDVLGAGCDPGQFPGVFERPDMPLHDMTGGSTWLPGLLTNMFPSEVNAAAIQAGIQRAVFMLTNAADMSLEIEGGQLEVTLTNNTGHKLPTGYPEGRRMWLHVQFYNDSMELLGESGAYDPETGILTKDPAAKIYEVKPGLSTNLANALGLEAGPSFHFVLNDTVYKDNRIPPQGFVNEQFALFGGAPVGHAYEDGQYWDETYYDMPPGTTRAEVRLYYQSTSKEFVEFLRDQNGSNSKGQELYDLWNNNEKCPPTLMASAVWVPIFEIQGMRFTEGGHFEVRFLSRPGVTYTIQYADNLDGTPVEWQSFQNNGTLVATETTSQFVDDFSANTSGGAATAGMRFYRFGYAEAP